MIIVINTSDHKNTKKINVNLSKNNELSNNIPPTNTRVLRSKGSLSPVDKDQSEKNKSEKLSNDNKELSLSEKPSNDIPQTLLNQTKENTKVLENKSSFVPVNKDQSEKNKSEKLSNENKELNLSKNNESSNDTTQTLLNKKRENIIVLENKSSFVPVNKEQFNSNQFKKNKCEIDKIISDSMKLKYRYNRNILPYFYSELFNHEEELYYNNRLSFIFKLIKDIKIQEEVYNNKNTIIMGQHIDENLLDIFVYEYISAKFNLTSYAEYNYFENYTHYLNLYTKNIIFKKIIDKLFTIRDDRSVVNKCTIEFLSELKYNEIFVLLEKIYKLSAVITINNDTMDFAIDNNIINKILSLSNNSLEQFNFLQIYYQYYNNNSQQKYLNDLLLEFHLNIYNNTTNKKITLDNAKKINNNLFVDFFMISLILLRGSNTEEYLRSLDLFFNNKYSLWDAQVISFSCCDAYRNSSKKYKSIANSEKLLSEENIQKVKSINNSLTENSINIKK